jgi:hypothetical protein
MAVDAVEPVTDVGACIGLRVVENVPPQADRLAELAAWEVVDVRRGKIDPDRFRARPGGKGKRFDRRRGFPRLCRILAGDGHGICGRETLIFRLRNQFGGYPDNAGNLAACIRSVQRLETGE